ncbi:phosphatase PAP2 family protein [Agromyces sp. G08B096]|uniref:Phosphatase PAP2 family protein n=1 Tax=Agromyces sp. G08B096 TaxID=3156399 RepID=A0AAU7W6E4_9MICO
MADEREDAHETDAAAHETDAAAPGPADARAAASAAPDAEAAAEVRPVRREQRARTMGRRVPIAVGIAAVLIAAVLGWLVVVRSGELVDLDEEWAEDMLELRGPVGDVLALLMNWLGGGVVGVFVVPVLAAVVLLICRRPWGAAYFILASAASAGVVQLLKQTFGRARPEDIMVVSDFGSFPSGHVANAATIAVALGVIAPALWVWIAGAVYTVLMAASRTYLGAHWLTDTLGGLLVGAGVALLAWAVLARPLERERLAWSAHRMEVNAARAAAHVTPPSGGSARR